MPSHSPTNLPSLAPIHFQANPARVARNPDQGPLPTGQQSGCAHPGPVHPAPSDPLLPDHARVRSTSHQFRHDRRVDVRERIPEETVRDGQDLAVRRGTAEPRTPWDDRWSGKDGGLTCPVCR